MPASVVGRDTLVSSCTSKCRCFYAEPGQPADQRAGASFVVVRMTWAQSRQLGGQWLEV